MFKYLCTYYNNFVVLIQLKDEIMITGVTVDHIPKELSPNGSLSSAPKEFSVIVSLCLIRFVIIAISL